ncbi:MAG: o-succinylbenzoate--CoA ligase [Byssovorax sp.]
MDPFDLSAAARDAAASPALFAGDLVLTFAELDARARAFAAGLTARGIRRGSRVAILAQNRVETVVAVHALLAIGAAIVPIHPRLTAAEVQIIVDDAAPALTLREGDLAALAAGATGDGAIDHAPIDPRSPLAIVYTSGTTGRPKGAILSRRAFLASAAASAENLGWIAEDRWLLCLPICHVGGLSIVTRCLAARRAVILEPRFDPDAVLAAIVAKRATLLSVVPTMLKALLERDPGNVLASLRAVLSGGAATPWALLEECGRRGVPTLTTYGLTEACSQAASQAPRSPYVPERGSGRALPGVELRVDGEGRIHLRGPTLMSGYFRGESRDADRERFVDGWLDTGDLGELDPSGALHVHARRTDLIVTGGENVYPLEIEQCLEALPGVKRALVFGVPDARWGQIVAAVIEAEIATAIDEAALAQALAARLAAHKRPRLFGVVDALAVTGSGKLVRASAAERHAADLHPLDAGGAR